MVDFLPPEPFLGHMSGIHVKPAFFKISWPNRSGVLRKPAYIEAFRHPQNFFSNSSHVVVRPRLNRIAPIPSRGGTPIAARTGDRVTEPAWQADPVEAATPGSIARISAPTLPAKVDVERVRQSLRRMAVERHLFAENPSEPVPESVAHGP